MAPWHNPSATDERAGAPHRDSLLTALCGPEVLENAWRMVARKRGASGVDGVTVTHFGARIEQNLQRLRQDILSGRYAPSPLRYTAIPKSTPGQWRELGIPTLQDRVVAQGLLGLLHGKIDGTLAPCSFAYRPGKSITDALLAVRQMLENGRFWCARGDMRGCFDAMDWDLLSRSFRRWIGDPAVLALFNAMVRVPVVREGRIVPRGRGIPQGSPLSPLWSNMYLDFFDRAMLQQGFALVRYADDWMVLDRREDQAQNALQSAAASLSTLRLSLHRAKSVVADLRRRPVVFLGHEIWADRVLPGPRAWDRARNAAQQLAEARDREEYLQARGHLLHLRALYGRTEGAVSPAPQTGRFTPGQGIPSESGRRAPRQGFRSNRQ